MTLSFVNKRSTRTRSSIAHSQMYFSASPEMLDPVGNGWVSGVDQSVVFQSMSGYGMSVNLGLGSSSLGNSGAPGASASPAGRGCQPEGQRSSPTLGESLGSASCGEPRTLSGQPSETVTGYYRWTRRGIKGVDYGGGEVLR